MKRSEAGVEAKVEQLLFQSRWLLAPFFAGLIIAILVLLVKFVHDLLKLAAVDMDAVVVPILELIDTALIATVLLIIAFSGYENFVSRLDGDDSDANEDRQTWMRKVGFSDLKMKLIGVMVAISALDLLKASVDHLGGDSGNINPLSNQYLAWKVGIHITFVISALLFAITDRITRKEHGHGSQELGSVGGKIRKTPNPAAAGGHEPPLRSGPRR